MSWRSFQRISKALINHLDCDEGREYVPNEGLQLPHVVSDNVHRELEKENFLKFWGSTDGLTVEAWFEHTTIVFALCDYTSNMKARMTILQLKGSEILWWKTIFP